MPMPKIDPEVFYDPIEAAEILRVSPQTLHRKRVESSNLPFRKFGRRVWYRGSDLLAALEATWQRSTSDAPARNADRRAPDTDKPIVGGTRQ